MRVGVVYEGPTGLACNRLFSEGISEWPWHQTDFR